MTLFQEKQQFRQKWVWGFLIVVTLIPLGIIRNILSNTDWHGNENLEWMLRIIFCLPIVLLALFWFFYLETTLTSTELTVKFFPFAKKTYQLSDIKQAYVRKYEPLWEYGGWGVRYTFFNGVAYNVSGKWGLQLMLKNGRKVLVGTQKPTELEDILKQIPGLNTQGS